MSLTMNETKTKASLANDFNHNIDKIGLSLEKSPTSPVEGNTFQHRTDYDKTIIQSHLQPSQQKEDQEEKSSSSSYEMPTIITNDEKERDGRIQLSKMDNDHTNTNERRIESISDNLFESNGTSKRQEVETSSLSLSSKEISSENEDNMSEMTQMGDDDLGGSDDELESSVPVELFESNGSSKQSKEDHEATIEKEVNKFLPSSDLTREEMFQPHSVAIESNGEKSSIGGREEEEDEYEGGDYVLRHDVFLPMGQHFKSKSNQSDCMKSSKLLKKHKALFDNLDRSFEKNLSTSHDTLLHSITICSTKEMKDVTRMCFAATAVVFSSHNPSVTTMRVSSSHEECDEILSDNESDVELPDSDSRTDDEISITMISRHQSDLSKDSSKRSNTFPHKIPKSPSASSILSHLSDEKIDYDDLGSSRSIDCPDTLLNEDDSKGFVDNMEPIQRPSVPFIVVQILWKRLIECRFHDKDNAILESEIKSIMKFVQVMLIEELGFFTLTQFQTDLNNEQLVEQDENDESKSEVTHKDFLTIDCIQVSHDINLQYGRYIAMKSTQLFPFYLDKGVKKKMHLIRTYEEESWNPEEALNTTMAMSCLNVFKSYSSKYTHVDKPTVEDQIQFEYSIEMLPWHLMRAFLYHDVVDILTDYSFIKSRMTELEPLNATQMHIADAEELHSSIDIFIAKNPNVVVDFDVSQILVESYRLVGGVIHSEDASRLHDDQIEEQSPILKLDNKDTLDASSFLPMSLSLQALGDSLSRYNLKSEAMKFYYRAMLKFEIINSSYQNECNDDTTLKSNNVKSSHCNLLMGGILSRIASVYEWQKNNNDAMLCYERALSFYSRNKSKQHSKGIAKILASMGELHLNLKEYESAFSCLQESLTLWKAMDNDVADDVANLLVLMGHVKREVGKSNEALTLFSEAMYDKISVYGKSHPEVGFLHQTIGVVYCNKREFQKGLLHFEEALRIRESALESVLSHLSSNSNGTDNRIQAREIEVAECMDCIGKVYENCGDLEESFSHFVGTVVIYRSHLIAAVSNQATIMISDLTSLLISKSGDCSEVSKLYHHLIQTIQIGQQLYSIDMTVEHSTDDVEELLEIESQLSEILYDLGLIEGAQYLYRLRKSDSEDVGKLHESLRSDAQMHFEQSIVIRKRMLNRLESIGDHEDDHSMDYEKITIAIISYELGKLFSCQEKNMEENEFKKRSSLLKTATKKYSKRECSLAISYFEQAQEILEESIEMAETLDYVNNEDDCWISRLHKTPEIYEEILHTMAVLYRKLGEYDKSVECYNKVSILLTRTELGDHDLEPNSEQGMSNQKVKVAFSSQSIGDILFDTGEYSRALKSYDEALQLRRSLENDSSLVAKTLCLKGNVLLKLRKWDEAILAFDEAFRIRVDKLPQDHKDIAECFHLIGRAYEGDGKLEQALEYFKKGQRMLSGHLVDTDTDAADLFFDLGNVVLRQDALSKHFHCEEPPEEDISLALTCLALCRDIYRRSFGGDALEVGNTLNLLGVIYKKYEEYDKAISSFESALKIFHGAPLDQSLKIAASLNNLASTLMSSAIEDYEMVFEYLILAKQTYEEKGLCNIEAYAEVMFNLGEANSKSGKNDSCYLLRNS